VAKAKEVNKNLFRPGTYKDEEGHRRMMDAMGVEMGASHDIPAAEVTGEQKWPLYKTFSLVLAFNLAAWAGLFAVLRTAF
jgi:hypothetical protein